MNHTEKKLGSITRCKTINMHWKLTSIKQTGFYHPTYKDETMVTNFDHNAQTLCKQYGDKHDANRKKNINSKMRM